MGTNTRDLEAKAVIGFPDRLNENLGGKNAGIVWVESYRLSGGSFCNLKKGGQEMN